MIKHLMKSIREYKKHSILAPIFVTGEVVLEVIIPFLMSKLIDSGIDAGDMNYIIRTGIILVMCPRLPIPWFFVRPQRSHRLFRICEKPSKGYVLQCAELFIFQYR